MRSESDHGAKRMRYYYERFKHILESACFPALWMAITIYSLLFIRQSFFLYKRFALTAYDLGIYDQAVWLISRFHNPFITVRGLPLLADHFDPILFLLAPLYWIWASPKTLLVAQTLALGIGAWPVYLIAMRRLGKAPEALLLSVAYLLYPALHWTNTFDFHPEIFAVPFLLWAFYFLDCKRWRPYLVFLALLALTKETAGLSVIMLGLYAFKYDRRLAWTTMGMGLASLFIALGVLQLYHKGEPSPYFSLYSHYGNSLPSVMIYMISHPIVIFREINTPLNRSYLFELLQPILFLALLAPEVLALAFPNLLSNLLSERVFMHMIFFQYNVFIIPFLFISSIIGYDRLKRRIGVFSLRLFAICLMVNMAWGLNDSPLMIASWPLTSPVSSYQANQSENILKLIPPNSIVSAQSGVLPHLTHRTKIYLFPNPFYPVANGDSVPALQQQVGEDFPVFNSNQVSQNIADSKVDYIILQPKGCLFPLLEYNLWSSLMAVFKSKAYGIVAIAGDTFLLKRGADHRKGIQLLARVCGEKISNEDDIEKALKAYLNL